MADLAFGETGEGRVIKLLARLYPGCKWQKADATTKHFDILCQHCGASVEVKSDRRAAETGNLCFEFNLFKHSKAEEVFYVVGDRAYAWDMEALKLKLLELHGRGKTKGQMGGDGFRNPLIIAKLTDVTEIAVAHELEGSNEGL